MKIKYYVPSYGRADTIKTLKYLSKAIALVSPKEYDDYIKNNEYAKDRILKLPDGVQGFGKGRCLNYMLDNLWDDADQLIIIDDDVSCVMAHMKNEKDREVSEEEFYEICENICLLAKEWGCGIWGLSPNSDPMVYDEFKPFRLHAYLDGAITGYVEKNELRYDEKLTIKEDVDYFLQNLKKYHKALRVEKYYLKDEAFTNKGGCYDLRNSETEKQQFMEMQKKWGVDVIRPNRPVATNSSKIRGLGGAIRLNLPFSGC